MAIAVSEAFKARFRGPIDRSQLLVEVLFAGATWTDVSEWVEQASGEKEEGSGRGTASTNTLNLTLINDDGRFSAKNSAGPYYGNLTPNKPIRVSTVWGSESVRLFTGYTGPWPTKARARECQIQAQDAARILLRKDIREEVVFNPTAMEAGYYLTPILERAAWLSGLRWDAVTTRTDLAGHAWAFASHDGTAIAVTKNAGAAVATYTLAGQLVMQLDLVDLLIPVAPLKGKALAVLDQLAKVVDGRIYFESQGQLVFRCPMYRNDSTLVSVETFTVDNLDDVLTDQGFEGGRYSPLINRAEVTSTPYTFRLDAAGQVLEESIPFKGDLFAKFHFAPGESYPASGDADLWCELPSGLKLARTGSYPTAANVVLESAPKSDLTKPGSGIRFKAGFPVFEQGRMKVAFENAGTVAEVIKTLTLKARLMRPVQRCRSVTENAASIALYDQRDWTYTNDLIPHATGCKNLGAWKVADGKDPKTLVTLTVMHAVPWLEINDKVTASETITKTLPAAEDFIVKRIKWAFALAAFTSTIEGCTPSVDFSASALPPAVAIIETSNQNQSGVEQAALPPQVIDGTQGLVGLNNVPGLEWVTRKAQKLTYGANVVKAKYCVYDGSFVHLSADSGTDGNFYELSPMTGDIKRTTSINPDGYKGPRISLASDGALVLYDQGQLYKLKDGILTLKASPPAALNRYFHEVISGGGMIFALMSEFPSLLSNPRLWVWNSDDDTQQNSPNFTKNLSIAELSGAEYLSFDGKYLYIVEWAYNWLHSTNTAAISLYDSNANTLTSGYHKMSPGEEVYCVISDGQSLWVGVNDTVSGAKKVIQASLTPGTWGQIERKREILLAGIPKRLLFDGMYVWALTDSHLYQLSPSGAIVASFALGSVPGSPKGLTFDGTAIWATLDTGTVYRVPRIVSGRQF